MTQNYAVSLIKPEGYAHSAALWDAVEAISESLAQAGVFAGTLLNLVPDERTVVFGAHLVHDADLVDFLKGRDPIIFNSEQLYEGSKIIGSQYWDILKKFRVWDYSLENVTFLRGRGARFVTHVPLGFVPGLVRVPIAPKTIDVLFYGVETPRRTEILKRLSAEGISVKHIIGKYGIARDLEIAQSRIVLNLHAHPTEIFEQFRISYLLNNAKAVVSEWNRDRPPGTHLDAGVELVRRDDIVETCRRLLANNEERRALERKGFETIRKVPQVEFIKAALSQTPEARSSLNGARQGR